MSDVMYCQQGSHIAPREQMTKLLTAKGMRHLCVDCKNKTLDARVQISKKRVEKLQNNQG